MFIRHIDRKPVQDNPNGFKIHFKISPESQCITGQFFGWYQVLDAFIHRDEYVYTKPFTYSSLGEYNRLFSHIKINRVYETTRR